MASATLNLLKKKAGESKAPEVEQETPEEEVVLEEEAEEEASPEEAEEASADESETEEASGEDDETETVDIEGMTGPQLDSLVKEYELEVPDVWWKQIDGVKKMTVPQKKKFLQEMAGDEEGETSEEPEEPVAEEKPAKASNKKSTAVATTAKAVSGEIVSGDQISDLVHDIENLQEKDARALVGQLTDTAEYTFFKLGGVLSVIQEKGWYSPYENFKEFVSKGYGIEYRRALYWINIYNALVEGEIPWEKVKHIGWTKLKEIAPLLTHENMDEWIAIAENNNTQTLIEHANAAKKSGDGNAKIASDSSSPVSTKTFKLHDDQKATVQAALDKAKEICGSDNDTVALEFIMLEYIGSGGKKSLLSMLKSAGLEKALGEVEKAFPEATITVELPE